MTPPLHANSLLRLSDLLRLQNQEVSKTTLKRIRNQITRREQELGLKLIARRGLQKAGPGQAYYFRLGDLQKHMPELLPQSTLPPDITPLQRSLHEILKELDEARAHQRELDDSLRALRDEVAELRFRDEALVEEIKALKRQRPPTPNAPSL